MGTLTQGVAAGSRLRLLFFGRYAQGYSLMAFPAILKKRARIPSQVM